MDRYNTKFCHLQVSVKRA